MPALAIKNLVKKYGDTLAVSNVSFEVEQGELFGFLGPNGAGKTTAINCITGIAKINVGSISVFGHDVVKDYREARKCIGLAPQEFNVDVFTNTLSVLHYVAGYYGLAGKERKKRVYEMLERFELTPHASKPFRALSGGLKRRLMLARSMVHDPQLLILDEPTAGIDVEQRLDLWKYLREINNAGKTILLTSHYLEEVEALCGRIAIINKGKIVAIGKKEDFVSDGRSLEHAYLEITRSL